MRLPNGYGSVRKLSGNRRKPWQAQKTIGWTDQGKQIRSTIGYYPTRAAALQALADYNNAPYDLEMSRITFLDAYNKWFGETFDEETNRSTVKNYESIVKNCEPLFKMKLADIRLLHLQEIINNCAGRETSRRIKTLMNQVFKWAVKNEYITKNYAEDVELKKQETPKKKRGIFTSEEVKKLWNHVGANEYVTVILMLIYSGVRINELLDLKKEDVNLEEQWFYVRASKTESGIREVPIADKVLPFWKHFFEKSKCDYVVCTAEGGRLSYDNFKKRYWGPLLEKFGMEHTPHETRHTCISMLTARDVNKTIIKIIVGHKSIMDLTEKVYTHIEMKDLLAAINKI